MSDTGSNETSNRGSVDQPGEPDQDLEPILWEDRVFIDSHKTAIEKAIESADGACGTVLTACFSLATAYGAAIALVAPKDQQAPVLVVSPFVLFALGAVSALVGKSAGIALDPFTTTSAVRTAVKGAVNTKRGASWAAVGAAAFGVILAGTVLFATYGQPDEAKAEEAEIELTTAGREQFAKACGDTAASLRGSVSFSDHWVTIQLDDAATAKCREGDKVTMPAAAVAYTRSTP